MKTIIGYRGVAALGASLLLIATASAAVPTNPRVYYNSLEANNTGLFRDVNDPTTLALGITALGDEITLAGTGRALTDLQYNFVLSPTARSGNETAQILLFANTGAGGTPAASPFYTGDIVNLAQAGFTDVNGRGSVTVNGISGFTLPDSFTFAVAFGGIEAGESAGLPYYNPPTTGSSLDDFWANTTTGWQLLDTPGVVDNFGLAVYAVPEPSTWTLMLSGLGMLGYFGYRRKR